ncbi:MAG: redox-sensing transcriptional repressor Rex [bacterium]
MKKELWRNLPGSKESEQIQMIISDSTVRRLSQYYRTLSHLAESQVEMVSSELLSRHIGVTAAQVRKDLSYFGTFGRRGLGYRVRELQKEVANILGINRIWNVALIGVGNIGRALLDYDQFRIQGFHIVIAFDNDPQKIGKSFHGVEILDVATIPQVLPEKGVEIGIIAVPARAAQSVLDLLVQGKVKGVLNFAPINLNAPQGVFVRHQNLTIELEALSFSITNPYWVK